MLIKRRPPMERRYQNIAEVLADLKRKNKNLSSGIRSEGSETYNCPACKDKGFILEKIPELREDGTQRLWPTGQPKYIEVLKDCVCAKKRQSQHLLKFS